MNRMRESERDRRAIEREKEERQKGSDARNGGKFAPPPYAHRACKGVRK